LADRANARPRRPVVSKTIGDGVIPAVVKALDQQVREDAAYHLGRHVPGRRRLPAPAQST
jgi:hypothetical protein